MNLVKDRHWAAFVKLLYLCRTLELIMPIHYTDTKHKQPNLLTPQALTNSRPTSKPSRLIIKIVQYSLLHIPVCGDILHSTNENVSLKH